MNEQAFERYVAERVAGAVVTTSSGPAIERTLTRASRTRQRPRWLALIKEPPMRFASHVAVGSPSARLAALLAATLLLTVLGVGAVVAGGANLLAGAGPIVVAQDGSGDFVTVTEAVDAASDGDVIMVKPGRYIEAVTITKDITLAGDGEDRDEVVIENPPDGPVADHEILREWGPLPQFTLFVEDADATISGLTVSGPNTGGITTIVIGGAPTLDDVSVVLEGPDGTWQAWAAIYILGSSQTTVLGSTFNGWVDVAGASATFEDGAFFGHVHVEGPGVTSLRGNSFNANPETGNGGVDFAAGATGVVEGNELTAGAIEVAGGSNVEVRDNTRIAGTGISVLDDGTSATITGNTVAATPSGITVGSGAAATIEGNTITGGVAGLSLGSSSVEATANTITGANVGIAVMGEATPTITGNTFCDNGTDLRVDEGNPTTLEGNEVCAEAGPTETVE